MVGRGTQVTLLSERVLNLVSVTKEWATKNKIKLKSKKERDGGRRRGGQHNTCYYNNIVPCPLAWEGCPCHADNKSTRMGWMLLCGG
jgi:hypothetical protein